MDITTVLVDTLSNTTLWAAIVASIAIIGLGFVLVKIKWFKVEYKKVIIEVVMKVGLPALAFSGFMSKNTIESLQTEGIILGMAFGFYIILCILAYVHVNFVGNKFKIAKVLVDPNITQDASEQINDPDFEKNRKNSENRRMVLWMLIIFGSTTFFGMPIISALYPTGVISANIWNIPYRIFLYSFCFMQFKGVAFNRANIKSALKTALLNPIVIATFAGLVLWLTQLGTTVTVVVNGKETTTTWFNFSVTAPYIHKAFSMLGSLCSPLIWLAIGITLSESQLKEAVNDKWVWIYTAIKLVVLPLGIMLIFLAIQSGMPSFDPAKSISMIIFAATPPATVAVAYAISEDKCAKLASSCSAVSTLGAVIMIPIWVIIGTVVFSL